jgi:hypothetical protein
MKTMKLAMTTALSFFCCIALSNSAPMAVRAPVYTDDGRLALPEDYREWVYLSSGAHAAVDNTFVQFYPTLLPIATAKGTLSAAYKAESK